MMKFKSAVAVLFVGAMISGCSSTEEKDVGLTDGGSPEGVEVSGVSDSGPSISEYSGYSENGGSYPMEGIEIESISAEGDARGGAFDDPRNPLSKQTIYFEYDSSQVQPEYMPVIYAHAAYLAAHPAQRIALQGHADERGTREYNIALAEQRSKSVARLMQMQGVNSGQMDIVSYGEEKPAVFGHNSDAWQKNRRVKILYLGQ